MLNSAQRQKQDFQCAEMFWKVSTWEATKKEIALGQESLHSGNFSILKVVNSNDDCERQTQRTTTPSRIFKGIRILKWTCRALAL